MNYQRIFVLGLFILNIQKIRGEMGGVIIEDISLKNDILIEDHTRTIDDYFIVQRCIDTFCIKNIGESVIKGVFIPENNIQHLSYYDDLGSVHKKIFRNSMFLLGFRYPVKPNERISFSVETIYKGTKKSNSEVWPFDNAAVLKRSVESTYFNLFKRAVPTDGYYSKV
ncbi:hypothetical protein NEIRO03_0833 [Nematocida sp. AWRm78]|nr:hypothetical protein NEIRO02_0753 [Nematocida sp. AWRm79]KAI5183215.1 hypothetical protein NEIRO03_0833 [Nematocida sp. AWRm78]